MENYLLSWPPRFSEFGVQNGHTFPPMCYSEGSVYQQRETDQDFKILKKYIMGWKGFN